MSHDPTNLVEPITLCKSLGPSDRFPPRLTRYATTPVAQLPPKTLVLPTGKFERICLSSHRLKKKKKKKQIAIGDLWPLARGCITLFLAMPDFQNLHGATINASWAAAFSITANQPKPNSAITWTKMSLRNPTSGQTCARFVHTSDNTVNRARDRPPHARRVKLMTTPTVGFNGRFNRLHLDRNSRADGRNATMGLFIRLMGRTASLVTCTGSTDAHRTAPGTTINEKSDRNRLRNCSTFIARKARRTRRPPRSTSTLIVEQQHRRSSRVSAT